MTYKARWNHVQNRVRGQARSGSQKRSITWNAPVSVKKVTIIYILTHVHVGSSPPELSKAHNNHHKTTFKILYQHYTIIGHRLHMKINVLATQY